MADKGFLFQVNQQALTDAIGRRLQVKTVKLVRDVAAEFKNTIAEEVAHSEQLSTYRSIYDPGNGQRVEKWGRREEKRRNVTAGSKHYVDSFTYRVRTRVNGATAYFGNSSPIARAIEHGTPAHVIRVGKTGASRRKKANKAGPAGQFTKRFLVFPRANFAKDAKPYVRVRSVKHPGQQAEHIIGDAVDKAIRRLL